MRSRFLTIISLPLLSLLAGCQTGEVSKVIPTSGGGQIIVPLTREGMKPGSADGYHVTLAALEPGKELREVYYLFHLTATKNPALKHIKIEDISDETAATLVDDADPKWEDSTWTGKSETMTPEDPRMKWALQITLSMRVYHFTLTRKDGSQVEFNHVTTYPPPMKALIRARWGEKY
jgi:hypothetical protein